MAEIQGIEVIERRKRELLIESDLNRQVMDLEWQHLRFRAGNFKENWLQTGWKWLVPVAGFFIARKFKKPASFLAQGSLGLWVLRKIWEAVSEKPRVDG